METTDLPEHARLLQAWVGERKQEEAAGELGFAQQTLSKLLAGKDAGTKVRLACRRIAGIPLSAWPTPDPSGITEADFADGSAAE